MTLPLLRRALGRATRIAALALAAAALAPAVPRPAAADELKPVKIFFPPLNQGWTAGYELIEVADARGFFAKYGIKAELTVVPWDQYTVALDSGALDLAPFSDYAYFINVYDKGLKAKEVVSSTLPFNPANAGDGLIVLADGPIKTPQDLKGKRIGTQWPSFSGVWFAIDWLTKHGVTKDDVTIVPVPQAQYEQVLQQGGIDAIIAYSPLDIQLRRKGGYRQLFSSADIAGRFITRGGTMASDKFIAEHPDLVKGYVSAIADAADWANAHPAEVIKLGVDRGRLDPQYLPDLYNKEGKEDYSHLRWAVHGLNVEEDLAFWLKLVEDADIVPKGKHKPSDFYTNAFNPYAAQAAAN
ncbi:ABC transporter substrate-binding protein [Labrys wisconsinensis]|uniref:ABC-type nitrate/sulfonate/bicarbonate transport system substrate-binding protein n=1 Tax=Labrys wisconsinensis TaxID=425677 RepID=A0ABU0J5A0_9HYPH|nr:ABC transporter substrate-binding protein [Labrys wisconsinensis]MDQ0468810.1 ABC-type nitrate/sulfonate/bicarbonate transport system substrate-binding protein [Labrys wisconsinensis]